MKKQHSHSKNRLTWQILRDYFTNSLSSGEMHEVEKKVMHDPFSNDAFDGLENFAPASLDNDISNLKARLIRKSGFDANKKQVSYGLLIRVAAVLILLFAASGVVIYLTRSSDTIMPSKVAQSTKKLVQEEPKPLFGNDMDTVVQEMEDSENLAEVKVNIPVQTTRRETRRTESDAMEELEPKKASATLNLKEKSNLESGTVLEINDESEMQPTQVTSGNAQSKPISQQNDVGSTKLATDAVELKEPLSDKASGVKSDSNMAKKASNEVMNRTVQSAVAAKPPTDLDNYKGKIFRKIMEEEPDAMGEFEVWFTINEEGELSDFEVTKSINRRTDRKIIKELKNSGNWTPAYISSEPTTSRASIQLIF
ncbi:hypothetical protein ACE1ET_03725 [Saccharicrinis sp. FJH62]|uniref:hypothetical protein n=1 Tax=Saccharicrinis sp. FJH62 TaxID=3344657 RepID=UPI0035D45837